MIAAGLVSVSNWANQRTILDYIICVTVFCEAYTQFEAAISYEGATTNARLVLHVQRGCQAQIYYNMSPPRSEGVAMHPGVRPQASDKGVARTSCRSGRGMCTDVRIYQVLVASEVLGIEPIQSMVVSTNSPLLIKSPDDDCTTLSSHSPCQIR